MIQYIFTSFQELFYSYLSTIMKKYGHQVFSSVNIPKKNIWCPGIFLAVEKVA